MGEGSLDPKDDPDFRLLLCRTENERGGAGGGTSLILPALA